MKSITEQVVDFICMRISGNYDVVDKSPITDQTISVITKDIQVDAAAKFMAASYPTNNQWVL